MSLCLINWWFEYWSSWC